MGSFESKGRGSTRGETTPFRAGRQQPSQSSRVLLVRVLEKPLIPGTLPCVSERNSNVPEAAGRLPDGT
jgi:hypothetical protein